MKITSGFVKQREERPRNSRSDGQATQENCSTSEVNSVHGAVFEQRYFDVLEWSKSRLSQNVLKKKKEKKR